MGHPDFKLEDLPLYYVVLKTVGHGTPEAPLLTPKFIETKYMSRKQMEIYVDILNKNEFGDDYATSLDNIWFEKYYFQEV